jgi:hypothetical protein
LGVPVLDKLTRLLLNEARMYGWDELTGNKDLPPKAPVYMRGSSTTSQVESLMMAA